MVPTTVETVLLTSDITETNFAECISIDENAQMSTTMTDEDVCRAESCSIKENDEKVSYEDEDDAENLVENPPTASEMTEVLRVLGLGVQHRGTARDFKELYRYDNFINNFLGQYYTTGNFRKHFLFDHL